MRHRLITSRPSNGGKRAVSLDGGAMAEYDVIAISRRRLLITKRQMGRFEEGVRLATDRVNVKFVVKQRIVESHPETVVRHQHRVPGTGVDAEADDAC